MIQIKLAFYKGEGTLTDKLIRWWTKSNYSHVELILDNEWYSTSPRLLKVEKRYITPNPSHWDYVEVEVNEDAIKAFFDKTKGAKYDWFGIFFTQFMPLGFHTFSKYFCSEWVAEALGYKDSYKYSPQGLYEKVN